MAYKADISRERPTCLVFMVDQSRSMGEKLPVGNSKSRFLADVINNTIYSLITICTKADGIRDYFDVVVFGYSGTTVRRLPPGRSSGFLTISELAGNPIRIENRKRKTVGNDGNLTHIDVKFPIWIDPYAFGWTNTCSAFEESIKLVDLWCHEHQSSYPPTIIHVTDGHPTDGSPLTLANRLRQTGTEDGSSLLFNLHIDKGIGNPIAFPSSEHELHGKYAKSLFHMSSELPPRLVDRANSSGYNLKLGARGYIFNSDAKTLVDFFEIGTRPS